MKNFTLTTIFALLVAAPAFSQTQREVGTNASASRTITQAKDNGITLLSPANGKEFNTSEGSKPVVFRWTAMIPKPKEAVTYRIKVWQLVHGQNGTEAMRSNQPIITKDVVNLTQAAISNLYTGPCKPPYLCDFVWAVQALNNEGLPIDNSYATTIAYTFKFGVEGGNKGNAGNTGLSTGKSTNANGDPVHGVDVKLGAKKQ